MAYAVEYTEYVVDFIIDNVESEAVYNRIDSCRDLLAQFPSIGKPYDPVYPAARPPFSCRVIAVPDTPFSLYYLKDDAVEQVVVFYVEHQASNPAYRFAHIAF